MKITLFNLELVEIWYCTLKLFFCLLLLSNCTKIYVSNSLSHLHSQPPLSGQNENQRLQPWPIYDQKRTMLTCTTSEKCNNPDAKGLAESYFHAMSHRGGDDGVWSRTAEESKYQHCLGRGTLHLHASGTNIFIFNITWVGEKGRYSHMMLRLEPWSLLQNIIVRKASKKFHNPRLRNPLNSQLQLPSVSQSSIHAV